MSRVPIFIEVAKSKEAQLCRSVVAVLLEQGMAPIGMATNVTELNEILDALNQNAIEPAIFIINTFEAKEVLPLLDPLMGDRPAIFLRRSLYAGKSGLMDQLIVDDPNKMNTTLILKKLTPRQTSIWTYGAKNAAEVTQRLIQCIQRFHADGDFRHFEIATKLASV